jgi:hypothetical protein
MNAIHNLKKLRISALGAAAVAVAAPALVFVGAGTAQALTPASNGPVRITYDTGPAGLVANIRDVANNNPGDPTEFCTYDSVGTGLQGPIPFNGGAFVTGAVNSGAVLIPGIPLNEPWQVTVSCPKGGSFTFSETY